MSPSVGRGRPPRKPGSPGAPGGRGGPPRSGAPSGASSGRGKPPRAGRPAPPRTGGGRGGSGRDDGRRGGDERSGTRRVVEHQGLGGEQVEGRQAIRELLQANRRRVKQLLMAEGMDPSPILDEIEALAVKRRVKVERVSRRRIDQVARTEGPQGVVALASPVEETTFDKLCEPSGRGRQPFLLVLDGITDPHNLGALLRSAECAGVTGVVLPKHRSAHLTPTVTKVAAGAIEYLRMALVPGIPSALQRMSGLGVWTVGLDGDAPRSFYELPLGKEPVALVLGSEGDGLSPLTRKRCDALAAIPQHGTLASLNVATAGAIACFDIARRRS
jgi:23S rRNA (guanosine2251-2'-O)-methyltransferase